MTTKKRLGKGLEALLGGPEGGAEAGSVESADLIKLPTGSIDPNPFQPRQHFDPAELQALAESLRTHGVLQPVLVRPRGDRYQLIAGERRLRACIEAKIFEIPARVLELDDRHVAELAMVENLQREDLNALEKAVAFRDYLVTYGVPQEELATRLGIDRSTISNLIRLLDLPEEIQAALNAKQISAGHARALLGLPDAPSQIAACQRVIDEALSVRQTEALVATGDPGPGRTRLRKDGPEVPRAEAARPPHFVDLESHLRDFFGTPVSIKSRSAQKGQIVIDFNTLEEFERVAALIRSY